MSNEFRKKGYLIARQVLKKPKPFYQASIKAAKTKVWNTDAQIPNTPNYYDLPEMQKLQKQMLPVMEKMTGLKLFKTYSYMRIYKKGDILHIHTDRPACEVSMTLTLGFEGTKSWPIFLTDLEDDNHKVILEPGDGLLYLGCELLHWREKFKGTRQSQVFLHYVNMDGPNAWCQDDSNHHK